jgi:hypothetical protein
VYAPRRRSVVSRPSSSSVSVAPLASISVTEPGTAGIVASAVSSSSSEEQQTHSPERGVTSALRVARRVASISALSKSLSSTCARSPRAPSSGRAVVRNRVFPAPKKPATSTRGIIGGPRAAG